MGAESIELYLDADSQAAVREVWTALSKAGFAAPTSDRYTPHITIDVHMAQRGIRVKADDPELRAACTRACGTGAALTAVGSFTHRKSCVLFLQPAASIELATVRAGIVQALGPPAEDAPPARSEWSPHVTLSRRVDYERLGKAVRIVKDAGVLPLQTRIERVVYWTPDADAPHVLAASAGDAAAPAR